MYKWCETIYIYFALSVRHPSAFYSENSNTHPHIHWASTIYTNICIENESQSFRCLSIVQSITTYRRYPKRTTIALDSIFVSTLRSDSRLQSLEGCDIGIYLEAIPLFRKRFCHLRWVRKTASMAASGSKLFSHSQSLLSFYEYLPMSYGPWNKRRGQWYMVWYAC